MPVFLDPPVDVTPATFGVYTDVDVSAHVSGTATGAILRVKNGSADTQRRYHFRANGASDDFYQILWVTSHNWESVPLDGGGIFEARLEHDDLSLELVGYFENDAGWPVAPVNVTPEDWFNNEYRDVDISALTGSDTALAALLLFEPVSTRVFARAKGQTSDLRTRMAARQPIISGVDGNETLRAVSDSSSQRLRLLGWLTDGIVIDAAPVEVTPDGDGVWTTHALPEAATGGIFWVRRDLTTTADWGARTKGSGLGWTGGMNYQAGFAVVGADANGEVELYREDDIEIYRLGWFFVPDAFTLELEPAEVAVEAEPVEFEVEDGAELVLEAVECAVEVEQVEFAGLTVDTRQAVTALLARPFDPTIEVALQGPPAPIGAVEIGGIDYTSFGAETVITAADVTYDSQAADSPSSTPFAARLMETASLEVQAFDGDRPGGASSEALGALQLANGDGRYDAAALLGWDGRTLEIWRGRKGMAFADFKLLLRGTAERVGFDEGSIIIALRSRGAVLDQPVNPAFYGGSGGLDGHEGIVGLSKPQAFGRCRNVPMVNIDPTNLVYQAHDGPMQAFDAVRDKGAVLTATEDHADYAALIGAALDPSEFATCLALGIVRLGGTPVGQVTADIQGDASGSGYVETTAGIARRIVTRKLVGRNLAESDLDLAALDALEAEQPAPVGYWAGTAPETAREVLDKLLGGVGGWHGFTRDGRFTAHRLTLEGSTAATITQRETATRAPAEKRSVAPVWQIRGAWGRVWAVQSADALAGDVSDNDRAFWSKEARYAVAQDSSIRGRHRLAVPLTVESYFDQRSDAETEAARLLALYGPDREIWTVPLAGARLGSRWLGDLLNLDFRRYGQPKTVAVIGLREDFAREEVDLVLWG